MLVSIVAQVLDASMRVDHLGTLRGLAVLLPGLAVAVRRLRDGGYAWPWIFIALVPLAGGIVLIVLLCQPSKQRVTVPTSAYYSVQ